MGMRVQHSAGRTDQIDMRLRALIRRSETRKFYPQRVRLQADKLKPTTHEKVRDESMQYVIRLEAVQKGIAELKSQKIHEAFIAFLYLRRVARQEKRFDNLEPKWQTELSDWLTVTGGQINKKHFRPFASRGKRDENFWMADNLAGSFAPSSIRSKARSIILDPNDQYRIPCASPGQPDVRPVFETLLYSEKINAPALACFLFRNDAFSFNEDADESSSRETPKPGWEDLINAFIHYFGWTKKEIDTYFDLDSPQYTCFEEYNESAV